MAGEKLMTEITQPAPIKPFKGDVKGYSFVRQGPHTVLVGQQDGMTLTTSLILRIDLVSMMVETRNSLYRLVD